MHTKIIVAMALATTSAPAWASDWWFLGRGAGGASALFIDAGSVGDDGDYKTVWTEQIFRDPVQNGVKRVRAFMNIDCAKRRGIDLKQLAFGLGDEPIAIPQERPELSPIPPDTVADAAFDFVCNHHRPGPQTFGRNNDFANGVFAMPRR